MFVDNFYRLLNPSFELDPSKRFGYILEFKINGTIKNIILNELDKILVYNFFWYQELELVSVVIKQSFSIDHFTTNKERSYGLMLVSPTE